MEQISAQDIKKHFDLQLFATRGLQPGIRNTNPPPTGGGGDVTGTGGPSPQVTTPLTVTPGSAKRGTAQAVIASVDNATTPKLATVLVNNKIPGESGYTFSVGAGPFAAGGTSGFQFFYNNSSGVGGSWCVVDLDQRAIISITTNVSTSAPTPFYKLITDHHHSGNLNPDGFTNPTPIDLTGGESQNNLPYTQNTPAIQNTIGSNGRLKPNPAPTNPPVLVGLTPPLAITYLTATLQTATQTTGGYDAQIGPFTITTTTLNATWFAGIRLWSKVYDGSYTPSTITDVTGLTPWSDLAGTTTGTYTAIWGGMSTGVQYALFISLIDQIGGSSAPLWLATTSSNPIVLSKPGFPGGSPVTPNILSPAGNPVLSSVETTAFAYPIQGAGTYDAQVIVTLDRTGSNFSNWLQEIELWASPVSGSVAAKLVGKIPPGADTGGNISYTFLFGGLLSNTAYQLMIRYIDGKGKAGPFTNVVTTDSTISSRGSLPKATAVSPSISYNSVSWDAEGNAQITFTADTSTYSSWISGVEVWWRQSGTIAFPSANTMDIPYNANNVYTVTIPKSAYYYPSALRNLQSTGGSSTVPWDFRITYYDLSLNYSNPTFLTNLPGGTAPKTQSLGGDLVASSYSGNFPGASPVQQVSVNIPPGKYKVSASWTSRGDNISTNIIIYGDSVVNGLTCYHAPSANGNSLGTAQATATYTNNGNTNASCTINFNAYTGGTLYTYDGAASSYYGPYTISVTPTA